MLAVLYGIGSLEPGATGKADSHKIQNPTRSPQWLNSKLLSPVVLGMPDDRSPLGAPQQTVYLRADNKIHLHFWNMAEDFERFLWTRERPRSF